MRAAEVCSLKTLSIGIGLLVLATAFVAIAPTGESVGICSEFKDQHCGDYWLCVGYRWGPGYFECTGYGIRDPVCTTYCPVLP